MPVTLKETVDGICLSHARRVIYVKDERFGCFICALEAQVEALAKHAKDLGSDDASIRIIKERADRAHRRP